MEHISAVQRLISLLPDTEPVALSSRCSYAEFDYVQCWNEGNVINFNITDYLFLFMQDVSSKNVRQIYLDLVYLLSVYKTTGKVMEHWREWSVNFRLSSVQLFKSEAFLNINVLLDFGLVSGNLGVYNYVKEQTRINHVPYIDTEKTDVKLFSEVKTEVSIHPCYEAGTFPGIAASEKCTHL